MTHLQHPAVQITINVLQRRRPIFYQSLMGFSEAGTTHLRVPLLECPQEVPEGVRSVMIQESGHVKGWYRSGCRWVLEEAEEEEDEECKTQHCCNSQGVNGLQQHGEVR